MSFDKEKWFQSLDKKEVEWDDVRHRRQLGQILQMEPVLAVLGLLNDMVESDNFKLRNVDFTQQTGVAEALKIQGRGQGINDVLQLLADSAEMEEEEEENAA